MNEISMTSFTTSVLKTGRFQISNQFANLPWHSNSSDNSLDAPIIAHNAIEMNCVGDGLVPSSEIAVVPASDDLYKSSYSGTRWLTFRFSLPPSKEYRDVEPIS